MSAAGPAGPVLVVSGPAGVGKTTLAEALAASWARSALVEQDAFLRFVRHSWIDPALPSAGPQLHAVGAAMGAAAIEFAVGGYTVVLDAQLHGDGLTQFAGWAASHGVAVHHVLLWAGLDVCRARAIARGGALDDAASFARWHGRFAPTAAVGDLGARRVDASGAASAVEAEVRRRFAAGRLHVAG